MGTRNNILTIYYLSIASKADYSTIPLLNIIGSQVGTYYAGTCVGCKYQWRIYGGSMRSGPPPLPTSNRE